MALTKRESRTRRHTRVRKKITGTPERPRLCVFRSEKHIYAQIIDDSLGRTLCSASSLSPEIRNEDAKGSAVAGARLVGKLVAQKAAEANVKKAVFDRGGYRYHGRVKELAEAAREAGLEF